MKYPDRKDDVMNREPLSKSVRTARLLVFGLCVAFIAGTFLILSDRSDPLSRYPYGTPVQRETLARVLDDDAINVLINSQIQPDQVLPYAFNPNFNILNTLYYDAASRTQAASPDFIVQFVNQYRDRFDLESLRELLSWLPYSELVTYFESNATLPLADQNPNAFDTVLTPDSTIFTWRPSDLADADTGIVLRKQAAEAWKTMKAAAAKDGVQLKAAAGFIPYDMQQTMKDYPSYQQGPYGSREEQLGLTVQLDGFAPYNQALSEMNSGPDAGKALEKLSAEQRKERDWLEANSWKYGWIIRYPMNKESSTKVFYQPFVLRYVTKETASLLHEQNLSLDEYKAQGGSNKHES